MNHILYVPGLNDDAAINSFVAQLLPIIWKPLGVNIHILKPHWKEGKYFEPKLQMIIQKIDELSRDNNKILLVGGSAGGSAVFNAFAKRKKKVCGAVNICGRLRTGTNVFPSLDLAAKNNPAFKESVLLFEKENEETLTADDRKRMLILRPLIDEIVPYPTVSLNDVKEITMPVIGHVVGGIVACVFYGRELMKFLSS